MSTVSEQLERRGVAFEAASHTETYTSADEARALGIAADEVVKAVMLQSASGFRLAVVPASRRLFPGFELGALPPLGSLLSVPTYVDPEVMEHETIAFAAGSRTESVKARAEDLFRGESVTVTPLTRRPGEEKGRSG
jgi:prolyl-tRNA editing enzyme YbaK/EbsC (Cys-tRNA(Pro) deacylase)